jgi:hypothetical protein
VPMITIFISFFVFAIVAMTHVLLHRWLITKGIKTFKSTFIFSFGFMMLLFIFWLQQISGFYRSYDFIPITAIIIYMLTSMLYIMLFTSPYTGDISPSTMLLSLIKNSPGLTLPVILKHFSNQELIENRLKNLISQAYVQKSDQIYKVLPKGKNLIRLIDTYRRLLNWKSSG